MPYSYFEWLEGFLIVHSTIGSTAHSIEQFGALYMHNHDYKYPSRPGFEPGTHRLHIVYLVHPCMAIKLLSMYLAFNNTRGQILFMWFTKQAVKKMKYTV